MRDGHIYCWWRKRRSKEGKAGERERERETVTGNDTTRVCDRFVVASREIPNKRNTHIRNEKKHEENKNLSMRCWEKNKGSVVLGGTVRYK